MPSPAAGLRYKVLSLPGSYPLDGKRGGEPAVPSMTYSYRSAYAGKDSYRETRIGLLPRVEKDDIRTSNFITPPDHALWTDPALQTAEGMWAFLEESFPQLDLKQVLGGTGEVERFAASRGGTFPMSTTTKGGAAFPVSSGAVSAGKDAAPLVLAGAGSGAGETAVVLVGDAMHHFPPDVGQGVNSALEDVMELGKVTFYYNFNFDFIKVNIFNFELDFPQLNPVHAYLYIICLTPVVLVHHP